VLGTENDPPLLGGNPVRVLTPAEYAIVRALVTAGERGLTRAELIDRGGSDRADIILHKLMKKEPAWRSYIERPQRGVFRITPP
jgi:hypothetical protein